MQPEPSEEPSVAPEPSEEPSAAPEPGAGEGSETASDSPETLGREVHEIFLSAMEEVTALMEEGLPVEELREKVAALKEAGNKLISIVGARSKDLLILEDEMKAVSDETVVTTDDGSYGVHGFVTDALKTLTDRGEKIDRVVAIGPVVMMRAVANATRGKIPTIASLNSTMVDGTGMCGGCRVTIGGQTKFACVDGPEFDGQQVDYDELMLRLQAYCEDEQVCYNEFCMMQE